MIAVLTQSEAQQRIRRRFDERHIPLLDISVREYPDETVFLVKVPIDQIPIAAEVGNALDSELQAAGIQGFVTVKAAEPTEGPIEACSPMPDGVQDGRAQQLVALLTARARASENQPSLAYVPDAAANLAKVVAPRHHLVFGRRGAGKTALLLEAKKLLDRDDYLTVWVNLQTYRRESTGRAFLWIARLILESASGRLRAHSGIPRLAQSVGALAAEIEQGLSAQQLSASELNALIPRLQYELHRFTTALAARMTVFLDDLHYVNRSEQPELLDMIHGIVRDSDIWMKVAAIKHLSNWFKSNPPTGLQTGHDADVIDLDVTLQDPALAKEFLERVLQTFGDRVGVPAVSKVFSSGALDRLVLAAGAVPRDYLVLASASIQKAQERPGARLVGKQDVAKAAGDASRVKLSELEEDAAAAEEFASEILATLRIVRDFCLSDQKCSFFLIDFREKDSLVEEYSRLESLMDARLIHLVSPSISDAHRAGTRYEVYMLDPSQFLGERFKKHLRVLDFSRGHMTLTETGSSKPDRRGDTPKRLLSILRSGPVFHLNSLVRRHAAA